MMRRYEILVGSGTYTPPAGVKRVMLTVRGGGADAASASGEEIAGEKVTFEPMPRYRGSPAEPDYSRAFATPVRDPHGMDRWAGRVPLPPATPPVKELTGPTTYAAGAFPARAMR